MAGGTASDTLDSSFVDIEALETDLKEQAGSAYSWAYENGRRYASTDMGGAYYMPNDEPEIQRLNEQHWILTQVKGGLLHHAPLPKKDGLKILDVGCGSGIWCIQMAEDAPSATIIGMDISPIQPKSKPANVEWFVHDMETEWPYPEDYFDMIRLSLVHGCVSDWDQMMSKITRHLTPGGWVEHQEFSLCRQYMVDENDKPMPMSDNLDELPPFFRWNRLMEQAALKRGRQLQLGPHLSTFQRRAGLSEVQEEVFAHKWGTWPSDLRERTLGARTMLSAMSGMEGFTITMFTKALRWSLEDTQAFIVEIKNDMRNDRLRKVMDLHVVYGQKPMAAREGKKERLQVSTVSAQDSRLRNTSIALFVVAATASLMWSLRKK